MLPPLPPQQVDWVSIEVYELVGTTVVAVGDSTEARGSPESQISSCRLLDRLQSRQSSMQLRSLEPAPPLPLQAPDRQAVKASEPDFS